MKLNKCKSCGSDAIDIVSDSTGATRAVCRRCGNSGKPANMASKRLAYLARQQAVEMREMVKTLAIEEWNKENPL